MKRIAILSSSIRRGRLSDRVALFLKRYLEEKGLAETELLDLKAYDFPLFDERFAFQENPSERLLEFTERLRASDGLIIVSPVYNGDYPAALKNVIDLYFKEWERFPVAVVSVTSGKVPGIATVQKVQTLMLKLGSLVVPGLCTVTSVAETFTGQGEAESEQKAEALLRPTIDGLLWLISKTE